MELMMNIAANKEILLKNYQPSAFTIEQVALEFDLHPEKTHVTSRLTIKRRDKKIQDLFLNGEQLKLISVLLNEKPVQFSQEEEGLRLFNVPDEFLLEIVTEINPQANTELTGLYISNNIFCTQCESEYFRKITYFLDRPDVMTFYQVKIIADKKQYPVLLSNGNLMEEGDLPDNKHFALWEDPFKKPSYLFALVAGDLAKITDHFVTMSDRRVALHIFSEKQNIERCAFAMECLKKSMKWDEEVYGREYDLDIFNIVAVNDFIFGAMENKSLNIFNAKYILANSETATDQDYADIDTVVAHEYFHNWSGNRVTCRDWFQLSLKEGFTIFREQSYDEDHNSAVVHRIRKVQDLRNGQFSEDAGPMAHPVRPASYIAIDNFYTRTVYNKGGEVVRMLKTILGADLYHEACNHYFKKFDGQAVTTDDFVDVMQEVSGRNLSQFRLWYSQAGTPVVNANGVYDASKKTYTLTMEQIIPPTADMHDKQPMMIPVATALLSVSSLTSLRGVFDDAIYPKEKNWIASSTRNDDNSGRKDAMIEEVLLLEKQTQQFIFKNIETNIVPSLNRHFSSPIKLNFPYTENELLFLFQHDTDGFNRCDAGQRLAVKIILEGMTNEHYLHVIGEILNQSFDDLSLKTELLSLPSEKYLHESVEVIDVEKISTARRQLFLKIASQHEPAWLDLYHSLASDDHAYSFAAMGRRRLRALALHYLAALNKQTYIDLAKQQFDHAGNMTESVAALSALSHIDCLERIEALSHFQDRWQHEPLVMNKWFMAQAQSHLPNTLANVKSLMQQPFFNIKNPNSVYALIGGFCSGNMLNFHDVSGKGYEFCADTVLMLDQINPMVAARIIEPLLGWKRFESHCAELMRRALDKVLQYPGLSKNVYEPVSKALESL
ncbi:MAG: aminopeptidase N [Pseudomonadota bacterium]